MVAAVSLEIAVAVGTIVLRIAAKLLYEDLPRFRAELLDFLPGALELDV